MANKEHLAILKRGVEAWNAWRLDKPKLLSLFSELDLSEADLSGTDLSGADLSFADLSLADLSGANLTDANLSGVNLIRADLSRANLSGVTLFSPNRIRASLTEADLSGANLSKANLTAVNLSRANLSDADLSDTNLSEANLTGADLSKARLFGAIFRDTLLSKTIFSSRAAINSLNQEISPKQLLGCVFLDEEDVRRTKEKSSFEGLPMLCLKFDAPIWTPLDASKALANVQFAINRVQYLLTTGEISPEILAQVLTGPCFPDNFYQAIRLAELHTGSLEVILSYIREAFSPEMVKVLVISGLLICGAGYACEKYVAIQQGTAEAFKCRAEGEKAIADAEKAKAETDAIRAKSAKEVALNGLPGLTDMSLPLAVNNGIPKMPFDVVEENIKVPSAFTPVSETVRQSPEKYLSRAVQPLYSFISVIKDQGHEVRCHIYNAKEWAEKFGVDLTEAEKVGIISDQPKKTSGDNNK